jgi:hypothetical protein
MKKLNLISSFIALLCAISMQAESWDISLVGPAGDDKIEITKFVPNETGKQVWIEAYKFYEIIESTLSVTAIPSGQTVSHFLDPDFVEMNRTCYSYYTPASDVVISVEVTEKPASAWLREGDSWDPTTRTLTVNSNPEGYYEYGGVIEHLVIGSGVTETSLSSRAFYNCVNLRSVTVQSTTCGGSYTMFENCPLLDYIFVPDEMVDVFKTADYWKQYANIIYPASTDPADIIPYWVRPGDGWDYETRTLIVYVNPDVNYYKHNTKFDQVVIDPNVTTVGENAFYGCTSVTDVYCFPNAANLTLGNGWDYVFKPLSETRCHVLADQLTDYQTTYYSGAGVTWVGDLSPLTTSDNEREMPLTFEARLNGTQVEYTVSSGGLPPVEYTTTDGLLWKAYSGPVTLAHSGDKIRFRGNNMTYKNGLGKNARFNCSADCYIYGNIMSLVDKTDYATANAFYRENVFYALFSGNTHIQNHPSLELLLPAKAISADCYGYMFYGCTGLTRAPELPATQLFPFCYERMFAGCTGLTKAPDLLASNLQQDCYNSMFYGCTNLCSVHCDASYRLNTNTTIDWLREVAETGTFYAPANSIFASDERGPGSIPVGWNVIPCEYATPLTFEAMENGVTVTYSIPGSGTLPAVEYSTDGHNWTPYTEPVTLAYTGDKVYFRGNNPDYRDNGQSAKFQCSADCYIYGNIMSLVNKTDYATATAFYGDYTFYSMFSGNTHIMNHPTKDLVLPATTMLQYCYAHMFSGCTGLTRVPKLPATHLAQHCYEYMFADCSGLTSVPEDMLPATTLADHCYNSMFFGCTGLTEGPALYAAHIPQFAYHHMFYNCSSLTKLTCTATSWHDDDDSNLFWLYNTAENGLLYTTLESVFANLPIGESNSIPATWNKAFMIPANEDPLNPGEFYTTFYHSMHNCALQDDGTEAYVATASGDVLFLTHIAEGSQVIPASTAVILKTTANNFVLITTPEEGVTFGVANCLDGVDIRKQVTDISGLKRSNCYVLSGQSQDESVVGVGFYLINSDYLKRHKAYLKYTGSGQNNAPKRMRFVFNKDNSATGINPVTGNPSPVTHKLIEDGQLIIIRNGVEYNAAGQIVK